MLADMAAVRCAVCNRQRTSEQDIHLTGKELTGLLSLPSNTHRFLPRAMGSSLVSSKPLMLLNWIPAVAVERGNTEHIQARGDIEVLQ